MSKRVLVTGSTGFIGTELVKRLRSLSEYEVHTLERYVTGRYTLDNLGVINHYANLTDYPAIKNLIREIKPEYLIHLAAVSAVSFSYDHYIEVSEADYLGTLNLAEACHRGVPEFKQFIMAGSSEEYGMTLTDTNSKLTEESELQPNSPYACAKVASDLYLRYMGKAFNFPYTVLRPFNTYGRLSNTHFFIERTITQMLKGAGVYLGDPNTVRDWLYMDDHVNGYLKALGNDKAIGQIIQLSTGKGYTTKETAELIAELTSFGGNINWNATPQRPLDARILIGDNSKAKKLLDWEPKYDLKEGLKKTIEELKGR